MSRFTYEEEATPEDFFVPVVWGLVVSETLIPWQHAAISLFASQGSSEKINDGPQSVTSLAVVDEQARLPNALEIV